MATSRLVYPSAVGGDIGCGMAALAFDASADALDERTAADVLDGLARLVPRSRHTRSTAPVLPPTLDDNALSDPRLCALARDAGRLELGTLGSGNHFIELQRDDDNRLWLMLHSGSRALGPAIRRHHLANAPRGGLYGLDSESDDGRAYLADMAWALIWADANRRVMLDRVVGILSQAVGAQPIADSLVTCVHNHVRRESHDGELLWVHRKGAMPAGEGEPGVIPGSMGSASFHVTGRGCTASLASSSHGAGRTMSRSDARRRISPRALARQLDGVYWDERLAPWLRDEAPAAYKDIGAVMRAQRDLVRIIRRLDPILSFKGA
jgi:tRNA-splicing ligase RtcB